MIGPQRLSRSVISVSNHQRTRMVSRRLEIVSGGTRDWSTRSLAAARIFVPPQAIDGLRPIAKTGKPGTMSPTAW
jgi:hypothetical protein